MDRLKTVKVTLEAMRNRAEQPLYNELDSFRHSPLTIPEQLIRYWQFSNEVKADCEALLRELAIIEEHIELLRAREAAVTEDKGYLGDTGFR